MGFLRSKVLDKQMARPARVGDGWLAHVRRALKTDAAITLDVADVLGGFISGPASVARNYQLPTAANLIAAMPEMDVGDTFAFILCSTGAGAITVTTNTGITLSGNVTAAAGGSRWFVVEKTGAATLNVYGA